MAAGVKGRRGGRRETTNQTNRTNKERTADGAKAADRESSDWWAGAGELAGPTQ